MNQYGENYFKYLSPLESELEKIHHDKNYIAHGQGKNTCRKIFQNVEYSKFENEQVASLKAYIKEQTQKPEFQYIEQELIKHEFIDMNYLKLMYSSKFKCDKAFENLRLHLEWRNDEKNYKMTPETEKILEDGLIYLLGRDFECRPIIIVDALQLDIKGKKDSIEEKKQQILYAVGYFLNTIRKYMFVPGKVENWFFLIDSRELGLSDLPVNVLGSIIKVLQLNFAGTLNKLCILNASKSLTFGWGVIKAFLNEETARKFSFLKNKSLDELKNYMDVKFYNKYNNIKNQQNGSHNLWPPQIDIFYSQQKPLQPQQKQFMRRRSSSSHANLLTVVEVQEEKLKVSVQKSESEATKLPPSNNEVDDMCDYIDINKNNNSKTPSKNQLSVVSVGGQLLLSTDFSINRMQEQQKREMVNKPYEFRFKFKNEQSLNI